MLEARHSGGPACAAISALAAAAILWAPAAPAQESPDDDEGAARHILFDIEDPPELDHRLSDWLSFGAALDSEFVYEGNFDLDASEQRDLARPSPGARKSMSRSRWSSRKTKA